jgi:Xaa-Pro aminopeptidase
MFASSVYEARRQALAQGLPGGLVLLPGHGASPVNFAANWYPFRQDSTFLYYAGLARPGLAVLMDLDAAETVLVAEDAGPDEEIWSGPRPPLQEDALRVGIRATGTWSQLADRLQEARSRGRRLHYLAPYRADQALTLARLTGQSPAGVADGVSEALAAVVIAQRLIKEDREVAAIEAALALSAAAFQEILPAVAPGALETVLAARLEASMRIAGGRPAFATIVTGRGAILHSQPAARPLGERDLLLVDFGAEEPGGYASDITRTLPASGRFRPEQRAVYDIVRRAQNQAELGLAPGATFREVHLAAAAVIVEGLVDMGLMAGPVDAAVAAGAHALFFPHGLGHPLGLDVHDLEGLGEDRVGYDQEVTRSPQWGLAALRFGRRLQAGMVMTVEPGIYFNPALAARWQAEERCAAFIRYGRLGAFLGLGGIRVEDDFLITAEGARRLGPPIPREAATLEALLSPGGA